jgi:hypothetical protein
MTSWKGKVIIVITVACSGMFHSDCVGSSSGIMAGKAYTSEGALFTWITFQHFDSLGGSWWLLHFLCCHLIEGYMIVVVAGFVESPCPLLVGDVVWG